MAVDAGADFVVIIPARVDSSRMPRKVLRDKTGKPLIQHTYESVRAGLGYENVYVSTDSIEVEQVAKQFGAKVVKTSASCSCGTDRVADSLEWIERRPYVVNVQCDHPNVRLSHVEKAVALLRSSSDLAIGTLAAVFADEAEMRDPHRVKVVVDHRNCAMYFSRSLIPHGAASGCEALCHIGVYAYRWEFPCEFRRLQQPRLEVSERLEQLRALYYGYKIGVATVEDRLQSIDTESDYRRFVGRSDGVENESLR